MDILSNLKKLLRVNKRKEKNMRNLEKTKLRNCELYTDKEEEKWEKRFAQYSKFKIIQNGIRYRICVNFEEGQQEKKEITEFIRKSLEEDLNLMIILINIGIKYELGTRTKVNRKRHKIQLFFS